MPGSIDCPACGAPIDMEDRFQEYIDCPYCATQSYIGASTRAIAADAPAGAEERATLTDVYTRFAKGMSGTVRWGGEDHAFTVEGRLQFEYDGGYWSEWYFDVDGTGYWLHEDEGVYIMFIELPVEDAAQLEETFLSHHEDENRYRVGSAMPRLNSQMGDWSLLEVGSATLVGREGRVPRELPPNYAFTYFDGAGGGYRYTLEVSEGGKHGVIHQGWPLEFEDITTDSASDEEAGW